MELWIRSQDKEKLIKINDIALRKGYDGTIPTGLYEVVGYFDKDTEYELLGEYESFERALEVLDEIQEFRDTLTGIELLPQKERKQIVQEFLIAKESLTYKMPKE